MQYERYEDMIVDRYGIVLEGWPLEGKPRAPSTIGSRLELTVLIKAWENGTARFRKLSFEELEAWRAARSGGQATATVTEESSMQIDPPSQQEPQATDLVPTSPQAGPSMDSTHSTAVPGVTAVFSVATGSILQVKQRKKRSDAGKKRGPNIRTRPLAEGEGSSAAESQM